MLHPSPPPPPRDGTQWVGSALRERRFLLSAWPWRAMASLATTLLLLLALMMPVLVAMTPLLAAADAPDERSVSAGLVASLPLLAALLVLIAPLVSRVDLACVRLVDRRALPRVVEPAGLAARWRYRLTQRPAWLRVVHAGVLITVGSLAVGVVLVAVTLSLSLLAAPVLVGAGEERVSLGPWLVDTQPEAWVACALAVPALVLTVYLCGLVAAGHVLLARLLLVDPAAGLQEQVGQLARSRARLVHSFDAERRRIERDLHDVAQQRVVTLTMQLGLAELDLADALGADHPATRAVHTAHEHATGLMTELRALIHGIHPQVLSDLGVGAAVDQLAATMPMTVELHDELGGRLARHVESTLYFCISEALTNAARHSGAERVVITLRRGPGTAEAEVRDDGQGGADATSGSGLSGMADRAAVLDGTVVVSSPSGGPTVLRISLPDDAEELP